MSKCDVIEWKSVYSIGHKDIDHEHKKLFKLAHKALKSSDTKDEILSIINELVSYTKVHFKNEEKYMK